MRFSTFVSPVLTLIFACGPEQPAGTDTDATTDPASSTGETGETGAPSTSDAPMTSTSTIGPVETTVDPVTSTTVDPVTSTTDDPSTGGPNDTGIVAQFWSGGLDHLRVRVADFKDDLCVSIQFSRPDGSERPGLTLPTDWGYQVATISQGTSDCLDFEAFLPHPVAAESIAGEGDWDTVEFCPQTLDLDLVLSFPQDQPWVPAEVPVVAAALPVQGC